MDNNKTIVYPTNNVRFYINKNKNEHAKQTNYLIRIESSDTDRVENEIKTFLKFPDTMVPTIFEKNHLCKTNTIIIMYMFHALKQNN